MTRNERSDKSGKILEKRIFDSGHQISEKFFIKDDEKNFENLKILVSNKTDVIILTEENWFNWKGLNTRGCKKNT